jgi:hypothetical protein
MKLQEGVEISDVTGFRLGEKEEGPKAPGNQGGLAFDGTHLILADWSNHCLRVFEVNGRPKASVKHYLADGRHLVLEAPSAVEVDEAGCLYVLIGKDAKKLIKLQSWREPKLLAASQPLHSDVLEIAVDGGVTPPLVWVANGAGWGSLLQLAGDDLSLKKKFEDSGETLSDPTQCAYLPSLNIDPETGHLYV